MMHRSFWHGALLCVAASLSLASLACGARMAPLTQEIRFQNNLSDDELRGLQYYLSDDVVLRRVVESHDRHVTGSHKLQIIAGKMVEQIVIEKGTPGVATAVGSDYISVSFEPDASLQFSLRRLADALPPSNLGAQDPNPFPANRRGHEGPSVMPDHSRSGPETGVFWLGIDPQTHLVPYAGKLFEPVGDTLDAHLLVRAESLEHQTETKRVLPGLQLPQNTAPESAPK
jgi:hypothetical protein